MCSVNLAQLTSHRARITLSLNNVPNNQKSKCMPESFSMQWTLKAVFTRRVPFSTFSLFLYFRITKPPVDHTRSLLALDAYIERTSTAKVPNALAPI